MKKTASEIVNALINRLTTKNYVLIFFLTLIFSCLFAYSMNTIKREVVRLTEGNQERIIHETKSKVFNWVKFAMRNLEGSSTFISKSNLFEKEENIFLYLEEIRHKFDDFDLVQFMTKDKMMFASNGEKYRVLDENRLQWYVDIEKNLETNINVVNFHCILREKTMNICTPVIKNGELIGSLCGVVKASNVIEKIRRLSLPENIYIFIITEHEEIFINRSMVKTGLREQIQQIISSEQYIKSEDISQYDIHEQLITISKLGIFDWNVGVGIQKHDVTQSTDIMFLQGIFMLIIFIVLVIVASVIHEFFYNKLNKKYKRVQTLIDMWIKDSSDGLMIIERNNEVTLCNTKATQYMDNINNFSEKAHNKMEQILKRKQDTTGIIKTAKNFFRINTYPLYLNQNFEGIVVFIRDITEDIELKRAKKEHEYILRHQEKMIEIGELIVGINHQLKQPINGLSILMSNIMQQHENNSLNDETFTTNMRLCQKNLVVMNNIIDLYRNYYKNSLDVVDFNVKECINNVIDILDTKIKRNNILLTLEIDNDLKATSIDNVIEQIILVLVQNAIDENIHSKNKNMTIKAVEESGKIIVKIIDYGKGLDDKIANKLFKNPIKTTKKSGTGFGLYFANRLACKKVNGIVKIENYKNPTIFVFEFEKILSKKAE